jgi:hypothetical protein
VAIGDLHRRNVLVSDDLRVHVVDFECGWSAGRPLGRLLLAPLMRLDRLALARLRRRYGATLDAAQRALVENPPRAYVLLRRARLWASAGARARRRERTAALRRAGRA